MKNIIVLFIFVIYSYSIFSQVQIATISNDGEIETHTINYMDAEKLKANKYPQMDSWPKAFPSDQSFKNMRGLSLENIDGLAGDELIFSTKNSIYAYRYNGELLWKNDLEGTAIYPPSVADITGDGNFEVIQVTGGMPNNGHIYVFDKDGNILPGWPISFNQNWILCAPTLADLNGNNKLEIIVNERGNPGKVHILKYDGTSFSDDWPVSLDGIPAATPSVGYCHKTNTLIDSTIYTASTKSIYAFDLNGNIKDGFPITHPERGYSYQSPLICIDNSGVKIAGANHGDSPGFYLLKPDGSYFNSWPKPTSDNSWTYTAPMAIGFDNEIDFFLFAQPGSDGQSEYPVLHAFNSQAEYYQGYPYERVCGNEGFISSIYDNESGDLYIFTGSNMKIDGYGKIHAYITDKNFQSLQVLDGFPINVQGFTFMNGVNLGDVDGNGKLNLVVLSYDLDFDITDSVHINVFELSNINYDRNFSFGSYKGNNLRTGLVQPYNLSKVEPAMKHTFDLFPNPVSETLNISAQESFSYEIYSLCGKLLLQDLNKNNDITINIFDFPSGTYFVRIFNNNKNEFKKVIKL